MNSKYIIIIIMAALAIVGIYHVFAAGSYSYPEFHLRTGQVADTEIIAPFDFPVIKSTEQLSAEQEESLRSLPMPFMQSDEPLFEAFSKLDRIWAVFYSAEGSSLEKSAEALSEIGYNVDATTLSWSLDPEKREQVYEELRARINELYEQGIYSELEATEETLIFYNRSKEEQRLVSDFLELSEARNSLAQGISEAEALIEALADDLIQPNILPDEERFEELSQRMISEIPQTQGMVLQNEVIVRKNTRVTQENIDKLESLQVAYKTQSVRRTPLQQMLLALGLFIYVFMILLLANHCYGAYNLEEKKEVIDFLPVNLGFILITLMAILTNHVFGINNLLIPYAMAAVAAAILVSVEYGVLYSVCSVLIILPFINWEIYAPAIFILSTLATLILIKRQKAHHEYLTIWFYLLVTYFVVSIGLSIYKSDPISVLLQNLGYGAISNGISIMGVLMIVPFYEKKWNRATKQTLLELLDFNHPLLKKMATSAVGTYHHSLIVGNLSERAAEAIGANPLLARVGSYYHDIGKIINTEIFTENNEDSSAIHDEMSPDKSASLIKNHVTEGVALARKYKIPQPVIDIIMQHHGTGLIRYFYDQAEKLNLPLDDESYRYPGPRPQSKEAALVMIADVVESTTKAKTITSEQDIEKIIDDTITRLIRERQFDEAPITMKDLSVIKEAMMPVLGSIYRKRLDYPDENDKAKHTG